MTASISSSSKICCAFVKGHPTDRHLTLVERSMNRCKCTKTFCNTHRMPEEHECPFDFKGEQRVNLGKKLESSPEKIETQRKKFWSQQTGASGSNYAC